MQKYGKNNFSIVELEHCVSQEELDQREIHWAQTLNTFSPSGYNLRAGKGRGICSPEVAKKIGDARRGQKLPGVWKKHLSQSHKGNPVPAVTLAALQANRPAKGTQLSDKARHNAKHRVTYILATPEGSEVHISNLKGFCQDNNVSYVQFHKLANGKIKAYKGWQLKSREWTRFL